MQCRPLQAAALFGSSACLFWILSVWWLTPALVAFSGAGWIITLVVFLLVCALCALPYTLFALLLPLIGNVSTPFWALRASIAYTVLISWIPSLIPGNPVHSQFNQPLMIQLLDLGGLPLLVFVNIFFQLLLLKAIINFRSAQASWRAPLITALCLMIGIISYGYWRIADIDEQAEAGFPLKLALLQPNLVRADTTDQLFADTATLVSRQPGLDLVVWPEFPPAFSMVDDEQDRQRTRLLSGQLGIPIMLSSGYVYKRTDSGALADSYYNAVHIVQQGEITDHYYKRILVPFFEYLPFRHYLLSLFPRVLNYIPGQQASIFSLGSARIIPAICYEVIFSAGIREFVDRGGNIIVNPVSDSWFGDSAGSAQHFSLALFRAVEYRLPLVRVANSGISAIVTASGKIEEETRLLEKTSLSATVKIPGERSVYARWGESFLYVISLLFILGLISRLMRVPTGRG